MRHPAEHFIKALMVQTPGIAESTTIDTLVAWGFLKPLAQEQQTYLQQLQVSLPQPPENFSPVGHSHRPSVQYLRRLKIFEFFNPDASMQEAWDILTDPEKRLVVEQIIMSRMNFAEMARITNIERNWHLTAGGIDLFRHYFWNSKLLTFDEWGRFLYQRTSLYERHMTLLNATKPLANYLLRIEQEVESKKMIKDAMTIAHFTLQELSLKPGTSTEKVKGVSMLAKTVIECHQALSTSDMALKEVLQNFERWRMVHPNEMPRSIADLAPSGNFSKSGMERKPGEEPGKN